MKLTSLLKSKFLGYLFFDILVKLMPFIVLPLLANALSIEEFKTVSLYVVTISFLLTLMPLGVGTKVLLYLTEARSNVLSLPSAMFFPLILLFLMLSLFLFLDEEVLPLQIYELVPLVFVGALLTIGQVIAVRFQAEQKSIFYGGVMFVLQLSFYFSLVMSYLIFEFKGTDFFLITISLQCVFIFFILRLEEKYSQSRIVFNFAEIKIYGVFILSVLLHVLVNSARFIYDRTFMAVNASDFDFVFYNIAIQACMVLSVLLVSINRYWTSYYLNNYKNITIYTYYFCFGVVLSLALISYFVAYVYISIFYSDKYLVSLDYIPFFIFSFFFQGLYLVFSVKLYKEGCFRVINISSVISFVVSVLFMSSFFELYGSYGVAIAVCMSWVLLFLICLFMYFIVERNKASDGMEL